MLSDARKHRCDSHHIKFESLPNQPRAIYPSVRFGLDTTHRSTENTDETATTELHCPVTPCHLDMLADVSEATVRASVSFDRTIFNVCGITQFVKLFSQVVTSLVESQCMTVRELCQWTRYRDRQSDGDDKGTQCSSAGPATKTISESCPCK